MDSIGEIKMKLGELNYQTNSFVEEIKKYVMANNTTDQPFPLISYFTHSINAANDYQDENLLLGGFHIKNLSSNTYEELYICLRIETSNLFNFSGKFRSEHTSFQSKVIPVTWERFNHSEDEKEHWFKLSKDKQLKPFDTISLSDLQLTWDHDPPFSCSIIGFIYTDLENEGATSLNTINLKI